MSPTITNSNSYEPALHKVVNDIDNRQSTVSSRQSTVDNHNGRKLIKMQTTKRDACWTANDAIPSYFIFYLCFSPINAIWSALNYFFVCGCMRDLGQPDFATTTSSVSFISGGLHKNSLTLFIDRFGFDDLIKTLFLPLFLRVFAYIRKEYFKQRTSSYTLLVENQIYNYLTV